MNLLPDAIDKQRQDVSTHFLVGRGIEIGALHSPLWVSPRATVSYVDRLPTEELRKHYPELNGRDLAPVNVVDDGERLYTFTENSLDFIIANHMLEHCENPLGTLRSHISRLKPGGCLYYAVPDKRFTFDIERPMTDFDHLLRDDKEGPAWSRKGHFVEWATFVDKAPDAAAADVRARALMEMNYSIHFHVWDADRFRSIIEQAWEYLGRTFNTEWLEQNQSEVIAVLRKSEPGQGTPVSQKMEPALLPRSKGSVMDRLKSLLG